MGPAMTLTCTKTGRFWRFETYAAAMRAARDLGLKDYEVTE